MKITKQVEVSEEEMFLAFVKKHGNKSFAKWIELLRKDEDNVQDLYHTEEVLIWSFNHFRAMRKEGYDMPELDVALRELIDDVLIVKIKGND